MSNTQDGHRKAIIGDPHSSFWLYDSKTGFDLTHPASPTTPVCDKAVTIKTTTDPITIDPAKSALVVVDMQNFFLSPALGRSPDSKGLLAQRQLLDHAIPAARKVGMQVIWLNWGLTQTEADEMPPAILRAFGFQTVPASQFDGHGDTHQDDVSGRDEAESQVEPSGKSARIYKGVGKQMGPVTLDDGRTIEAGRLLVRDQWNTDLTPELSAVYHEGLHTTPSDAWIHKNRMSGLWGQKTDCTSFFDEKGITTLFFAGVNTDQCVGGSMTDAFSKGYDCILLSDGAGTTSPASSQDCYEYNAAKTYGFCTSCKDLWDAVQHVA